MATSDKRGKLFVNFEIKLYIVPQSNVPSRESIIHDTMNVYLRISLICLSIFLMGTLRLPGQTVKRGTLEVFQGTRGEYYFDAIQGAIKQQPKNGKLWVDASIPGAANKKTFKLIYEPSKDFVGLDTFRYTSLVCFTAGCLEEWEIQVKVKTSEVNALPDLFYLPVNAPETPLNVLRNDSGSSGSLSLRSVSMVNNGQSSLSAGSPFVMFKPRPGFTGVAQLIYTVCDPLGTCGQASASVVVGQVQPFGQDTLRIFTLKNEPVDVLVPNVYFLLEEPSSGRLDSKRDIPRYSPKTGFAGNDYMVFVGNGKELTVEVVVLDVTRNKFAFDDQGNTMPGRLLELDVLANDAFGNATSCLKYSPPRYGRLVSQPMPNGVVVYEAPRGFIGVDEFTYTASAPGCTGTPETATVRIYVSNFEPARSKFRMNTPMNTPLAIAYNIPISEFKFNLSQKARKGEILMLNGLVDTTIRGAKVFGYNALLYVPNPGATGMDEFEVIYCLKGVGPQECQYQKSVKIEIDILPFASDKDLCFGDCVWAGDTNMDGVVNMEDLLPLGRYMGRVGLSREAPNLDIWFGQYGKDWKDPFVSPDAANLKYVDTDGNSIITADDTVAIGRFFGRTHSLVPVKLPYADFEIRLEGDLFSEPGKPVNLEIILGDEKHPVTDLHGFTFDFSYNPFFFDANASSVEFLGNSWLTYNAPVLGMVRNDGKGIVSTGFTRTNGVPAHGYGKVGRSKVVVTNDIIGVSPPDSDGNIHVPLYGNAVATNSKGEKFAVRVKPTIITIKTRPDLPGLGKTNPVKRSGDDLLLFPNPSRENVNLFKQGHDPIERIQVFSVAGQLVMDSGNISDHQYVIPVKNWLPGIYVARVKIGNGEVATRKIEVIR